jgi:hypothetical protein
MNLFRAAMHPVSFCTSLMHMGAFMLVMAEIFSELSSMPREDHVWFEDRWMVASLCDE